MNSRIPLIRRGLLISFVALLALPVALQAAEKNASYRAALESITADDLLNRDKALADPKMDGREAGTPGGEAARKYLIDEYTRLKLQPAGSEGKFEQPVPSNLCNIVGVIPGRDPELKNEYVLVEAHYDHVGHGGRGTSYDPGDIHPGADDNASGSSALIELVEAFSFLAEPPKRSVLILATDGEEKGLIGSKFWAAHPTVPIDKVVAGINIDMIGRLRDDKLFIYGSRTGIGLRRMISEQNGESPLNIDFNWQFVPNSDAYPIFEKGVPTLLVHTGVHENYHRTSDTPDRLNAPGMSRVVRLTFGVVNELADRPDHIAYRAAAKRENERTQRQLAEQSPKPPSRLGISVDGSTNSDASGVRIAKVEADSPAARAGLKADDRILEFAGQEVKQCDELIAIAVTAASPAKAVVKSPKDEKSREVQIELAGRPLRLGVTWRVDEAEPKTLIVMHVVPGSPAALAGLKANDRIYQIAGRDFADENEFIRIVGESTDSIELLIERNGQIQSMHINLKASTPLKQAA
jgi:hypothetical protein